MKGGHGASASAVDVLFDGSAISSYTLPWVDHPVSTHGTGCSLGAALAAELTAGKSLADAVAGAKAYVHGAIANSWGRIAACWESRKLDPPMAVDRLYLPPHF